MSTILKVAERAGVSRTTVSHVLNHADRVSKPLRERVEAAIAELGYVPNPQAKSLRTGRTNVVATIIPDIRNPFYTHLVKTAQLALEEAGIDTLIFNTDVPGGHATEHVRDYLRQISHKRVDGLIVGDFALHGMHDALVGLDMPAVFIGHLPNKAVDTIEIDDFGGGYQMGAYLAQKGHKRVALVTGPREFKEAMFRAEGFEKGLADNGVVLTPDLRFEGTYLPPSGQAAVDWMLRTHGSDRPTAIFFSNYLMASGGLAELYDRGIGVPKDIAVAVFGDDLQFEYVRPRLTRVGAPISVLAERAIGMLLERIGGKYAGPPRSETVACVLHALDSA